MDHSSITYRKALQDDIPDILRIIDDAKSFLRASGVDQWQDGFPGKETILDDISSGRAYLMTDNDADTMHEIAMGFFVLSFEAERSYINIEGTGWLNRKSQYSAIHRAAISSGYRGHGLSDMIFRICENETRMLGIPSIRIDTHIDNHIMQHLILKNGYTFCGVIRLSRDNAERLAYEKLVV